MKRGPGPARRTPLRQNPDRARAFVQRGRQELTRSQLKPAPARKPGPADDPSREEMRKWREEVWRLDAGRCRVSGHLAQNPEDRRFAAHHVVSQHELRARRLHRYRADPRLGVWLTADAHERHENASARVPWTALPGRVWVVCAELDALEASAWATDLVKRLHPAPGFSEHT